jgi:hypothetical protein
MGRTIGLLMVSDRSDVTDAGSGRPRACITKDAVVKMVCMCGARNAQIKRPTTAVGSAGWLREIERGYRK